MAAPQVATPGDGVAFPRPQRRATASQRAADGAPTRAAVAFPWGHLAAIVVLAALLRAVLFAGYFGSDELTYLEVALGIAAGRWESFDYVGALRYGVNLPNALFLKLFGVSEFSANLWSLLCSVGEVALVFVLAQRLWGTRAAWLAAAVIGVLPLHVHFGARLLADAPLAFFVTLSFVLVWFAQQRRGAAWYVAAGVAAGYVFWIKEVVVIYWAVFAIYALARRRWSVGWLWFAAAALAMIGLNCALLWAITGDALHIVRIVRAATANYVHVFKVETSPWYYLGYLFVDIKHVWLMAYLALAGIALWAARAWRGRAPADASTGFVVAWALGLLALFSFAPISLAPFTLIAKQTNYMLIFTAPLCLLAGYALAHLRGRRLAVVLVPLVAGSLLLCALEQQVVRSFSANSKAAVAFAQRHRQTPVYAASNAYSAGHYAAIMHAREVPVNPLRPLAEIANGIDALRAAHPGPTAARPLAYAIVDEQTMGWGTNNPITTLAQVPACWQRDERLVPAGYGYGYRVVEALGAIVDGFPQPIAAKAGALIEPLRRPRPAYVYSIGADCRFSLGG